jgi:hypothetical protein
MFIKNTSQQQIANYSIYLISRDLNGPGRAKHENVVRHSRYAEMSLEAQNMKTGPDTFSTIEIGSESTNHENMIRRPRYRQERVRKLKT